MHNVPTTRRRGVSAFVALLLACGLTARAGATPPAWAPAHGWRAHHGEHHADRDEGREVRHAARVYHYDYYPRQQVYFAPERHVYFWLDGGTWRTGVQLPSAIVLGSHVPLELDDERPYARHPDVTIRFPIGP